MIVTTEWLQAHLNDDNLRIIDIRGHVLPASEPPPHYFHHRADYDASHIPGAVFVDWVNDITDPDSPNGTQIAPPEAYAALMSRLGIGDDSFVVVYDDANGMFAARMWWSLHYYGHSDVAVLDGGWQKWTAEGLPVTADTPTIPPATFTPRPNPALRRTIEEVAAALDKPVTLLDVRSEAEFNGETSRVERAGRIPGAVNFTRKQMLGEDGGFAAPETLRERFAAIGLTDPDAEVVVYCNAGVSASYGMMALKLAGFQNIAVYDGSWKEWGRDDTRPIE